MELRPSAAVAARRVHDEVVLVDLGTGVVYALNATAARFWELLTTGLDRRAIEQALLAEFDVDPRRLDGEIRALTVELSARGILVGDARA